MKKWFSLFLVLTMILTVSGMAFAEENSGNPDGLKFSLSGHSEGFGDADVWISGTAIDVLVDSGWEDAVFFDINGVIGGSDPIHAIVGFDKEGLWFAAPGIMEEKYFVSYESLKNVAGEKAEDIGIPVDLGNPEEFLMGIDADALFDGLGDYLDIIMGIATEENTVTTSGDYELKGLGETVSANIVTLTPTQEDWSKAITGLLTKLQDDETTIKLIEAGAAAAAKENGTSAEETMQMFRNLIASGIENADSYAQFMAGVSFTLVKTENGVAGVKVEMPGLFSVGYEGFGSLADARRDAVVSYSDSGAEVLALNSVSADANGIIGKFTIDMLDVEVRYAFGDGAPYFSLYAGMGEEIGAQLTVADSENGVLAEGVYNSFDAETEEEKLAVVDLLISPDQTEVELPEGDWTELETEEEITQTAESIYRAISAAIGVAA